MHYPGFIGSFATSRSWNFNKEDTINRFLESRDAGLPKGEGYLLPTPGLRPYGILPAGPIRNLYEINGRTFVMAGTVFAELLANQTAVLIGQVTNNDDAPGSIVSNGDAGHQVLVISGGNGYIYDLLTESFDQILDDGFPAYAVMAVFADGRFIVLDNQSTFHLSDLEDGLSWNATQVAQVSSASDRVLAIGMTHRELWTFGGKTTEPWANVGDANFPYQPAPGTLIEQGIGAIWSIAVLDNTLFWLGQDAVGKGIVYRANGYTPARVSTFAVENYLRDLPRFDDAIAFTYQEGGHLFYWLYLPQANESLVYDVATQAWHKRAIWNDVLIQWEQHVARCLVFAFGKHLVGDRFSGTIYEMNQEFYSDQLIEPTPVV
jgi:hypothetical protein